MPLDVIMPALGMAQESGVIVAWHKKPGDPVAEGDVLFEVETDKATMEVEAQGEGYLSGVLAKEGEEVAVGNMIARITDNAEDVGDDTATTGSDDETPAPAADMPDLPTGQHVIMPTLGMAQDSGLLVGWLVEPGTKVGADDPLFEVETDKSTMEVPAGAEGYLAAQLAKAGDDVPTGEVIAILTADAPKQTTVRGRGDGSAAAQAAKDATVSSAGGSETKTQADPSQKALAIASSNGRILASPKARRLALERGLNLARLVKEGVPQPFHARDIETLKALPPEGVGKASAAVAAHLRLTAEVREDATADLADWAAEAAGLNDPAGLLAALASGSMGGTAHVIAYDAFGKRRLCKVTGKRLGAVATVEDETPDLILRDLRASRITTVQLGPEEAPVMTITTSGKGLALTLEYAAEQLAPSNAIALLNDFAGRIEDPLRHLL